MHRFRTRRQRGQPRSDHVAAPVTAGNREGRSRRWSATDAGRLGLVLGVLLLLTAVARPGWALVGAVPVTTASDGPVAASASPVATAATSDVPDAPPALMTAAGVPVTVRARLANGRYLVTSPCGHLTTISGGTPIDGVTVMIDPGHGGETDPGAVQNGIIERDLNLSVAQAVERILRARGVRVLLTRTADYGSILSQRAALADALGASLMVSIHHNSAPSTPEIAPQPGTEVFVQATAASERLGGLLYEHVTGALGATYPIGWYRAADAGVLRVTQPDGLETYGMIRHPRTTTALIEMGWLLNPVEAADVYRSASYPSVAARALADAIQAYLAGAQSRVAVGRRTFTANRAVGGDRCVDPALE